MLWQAVSPVHSEVFEDDYDEKRLQNSLWVQHKVGPEVGAILAHFPAGSIDSVKKADQALEIVRIEKQNINARLYNEKLLCNEKFLVYMCYDEAEERRRIDLQGLYMLELEAKRFKRSDDVRQRDLALDRSRLRDDANAAQREESLRAHEERIRRVQEREAKREAAARGRRKRRKISASTRPNRKSLQDVWKEWNANARKRRENATGKLRKMRRRRRDSSGGTFAVPDDVWHACLTG